MKQSLLVILILAKHVEYSNKSSHTIEESMHVKFEKSNAIVENVVEIDSLGEDMEKISLKDSPIQDEMQESIGEIKKDEVEQSQPLPKDWKYASNHLKDLIIGDVSKGVTTRSKLCMGIMHSYLILNPKTSSKPRVTHIGC